MRTVTINLPDYVAHRLEVCAAKDNQHLSEGIEQLLLYLVKQYEEKNNKFKVVQI